MYTLKSAARRTTLFGAATALLAATVLPAAVVLADGLNPLTERSLLLTSSAPGYTDTDGAGNAETQYSGPGTGPNGKKTGETFSFKVSTDSAAASRPIKAFTLQYCTKAAGVCQAPGNNGELVPGYDPDAAIPEDTLGDARNGVYTPADGATPAANPTGRPDNDYAHTLQKSDLDVVGVFGDAAAGTIAAGQFQVLVGGVPSAAGWTMDAVNGEDQDYDGPLTGKMNLIRITSATGVSPTSGQEVKIVFKASTGTYITNPGKGAFFVKINTYDIDDIDEIMPQTHFVDNAHVIDGGVTVANVMTDSIHITTKVLETMSFSVGTQNRDNVIVDCEYAGAIPTDPDDSNSCEADGAIHGTCDPIKNVNNNRLNMGDPNAEYSLETGRAWDVYSYWRLSSNSSGGAAVYYSGNTLSNTVGDEITDMPAKAPSTPGTEQFGLGFVAPEQGSADFVARRGLEISSKPFVTLTGQSGVGFPAGQDASADYADAAGAITGVDGSAGDARFKFNKNSLTVPELIAKQSEVVISCATAKMRYIGNIAADTPAGIYTSKINYLAAPQY